EFSSLPHCVAHSPPISCVLSICSVFSPFSFFFSMIRRPPRSTLFPTRRSSDLAPQILGADVVLHDRRFERPAQPARGLDLAHVRSEEHTSELQSHLNLVCRLLLEKKNKTHRPSMNRHI